MIDRLPPPPLFTIRPPPKPPGPFFEQFQTIEILNGQCVLPPLNFLLNSTSNVLHKHEQQINWLNLFLLILALVSVISCIIIAIFIFICLKKLKKEEKQYKNYVLTGSLARSSHQSDHCKRANEHYKCTSNALNCCDDSYSHQLIPLTDPMNPNSNEPSSLATNSAPFDTLQNHQYECIPDYFLTMARHPHSSSLSKSHICHYQHTLYHRPNPCSIPYATFSRSLIHSQGIPTTISTSDSSQCTCSPPPSTAVVQEESSTPLLPSSTNNATQKTENISISSPKSLRIGWTRRSHSSIPTKIQPSENHLHEQRFSFLSQLRKSSVLH
ncbi:unnamed protein product [Adineta ricciae]|uniref:Uncharacterized protein n=1 Tax=Adineta ricciae TaxID=249248 RepID=A0A815PFA6_ADIRI|nr:unnamed protein product [Adineta ricciae]